MSTPEPIDGTVATKDWPLPSAGPRVTLADIEANIASEVYFTAADGCVGCGMTAEQSLCPTPLSLLTICVLVLRNGFTVLGESACASPANFDPAIGRRIAREKAVERIWPLMGYELRTQLAGAEQTARAEPDFLANSTACNLTGEGACEACQ